MPAASNDVLDRLARARPLVHQHAAEIQPFGHLVKLPIALEERICRESVDTLRRDDRLDACGCRGGSRSA